MHAIRFIFLFFLLAFFSYSNVSAQTSESTVKTFDKDGLKFSYASDWTITDKSSKEMQYLLLSKENTTALISIASPRKLGEGSSQTITYNAYVKAILRSLSSADNPAEQEYICLDSNDSKISGTKFAGLYKNEPSKGEIYPFVLGDRFLTLAYIRTEKEAAKTDIVLQDLIKSLQSENSDKIVKNPFIESDGANEGIINSKALKLAKPKFYADYRGMVMVEVEIDETGKVVAAKAISGQKMMFRESEVAARLSKFNPTVRCGKPVRVIGTILYQF